jgi:hypothetical protein
VLHVLASLCLASAAFWAFSLHAVLRSRRSIALLRDDDAPAPARWPRVSIIVAARDEARDLERCLRTRLADDYPDLEIVLVDDRSTDGTGEIADRLAREDARVKVVHVTELPPGWLGKVHALERGVALAGGGWLLFSDADVEVAPGALRRAIARCEHDGKDHLSVVPAFREHGLLVDAAVSVFCHVVLAAGRPWKVPDPRSRAAIGAGLFNLVRREAFDRTPGFEWLRLEIADDITLAQMLKRHGARPLVMNAVGAITLDFYRDVGDMAAGMEKSGFAVISGFSAARMLLVCALGFALQCGFFAGLAHPARPVVALAITAAAAACASQALLARWLGRSLLPALLFPLGCALTAWMVLRSGVLVWRRGGVAWRGTVYPVRALREGSRIELT